MITIGWIPPADTNPSRDCGRLGMARVGCMWCHTVDIILISMHRGLLMTYW